MFIGLLIKEEGGFISNVTSFFLHIEYKSLFISEKADFL